MDFLRTISNIFWSEKIWLPSNFTWKEFEPKYDYEYTDYRHLYTYGVPIAIVILLVRFLVERFYFASVGRKLGIKSKRKIFRDVAAINKHVSSLKRREKPSTLVKFCENGWRSLYYTSIFIYGLCVLWDKPWFWRMDYCWIEFPYQGITRDVWWYYMVSLAFYYSLAFSQFFDVKRKDFWQMFIHHIATIMLISFSWICNFHRIGTLILFLHDASDVILDSAKTLKYTKKYDNTCTVLFGVFIIVWTITRIIIFPFWILKSTLLDAPHILKIMTPAYYIFNGLLLMLQILHMYWTKLIVQTAYRTWTKGKLEDDIRSSSSSEDSDDCCETFLRTDKKRYMNETSSRNDYKMLKKNLIAEFPRLRMMAFPCFK